MFKYIKIGELLKPFKTDGEFIAAIDELFSEDLLNSNAIFIKENGLEVPFFIEYIEYDDELYYIKIEEFDSPEKVKKYNSSNIYLRECDISNPDKLTHPINKGEFEGFSIYDKNSGKKHQILRIEEYPQQLMAIIEEGGSEHLIPLVEDFIESIDYSNNSINMNLPLNLIE
ncbi:MAG TPA: hypothetical protein ENK91_10765 [Bacteroidetes bacterium]|nr:hypothetical protein [Bacteroidota bacterium]